MCLCCGWFAPVPGQHSRLSGSSAAGAVAAAAAVCWGSGWSAAWGVMVPYRHPSSHFVPFLALSNGSSGRQQCWSWRAGGGVQAAADGCWRGSEAAGHRQGPCHGLVSGFRGQSAGLQRSVLGCADLGRPPVVPPQAPGATVVGGVYRSTLGDHLSTLCSEVGLGRGGLACVPIWSWVESPLVCVAGFFGCGPCQRSLPSDSSLCFSLDVGIPPFRAVSSLLSSPAKDFPSV